MRELVIALGSVALVAAVEGLRQLLRWSGEQRKIELRRRLQAVTGGEGRSPAATLLREGKYAASPALDALLRAVPLAARAEKLLERADSRLTVAQLVVWIVLAAFAGVAAASLLGLGLAVGLVFAVGGAVAPALFLGIACQKRSLKLSEQLPEALDMMSRSLRAGHALTSAFEVVASEMPEPVSVEFARAFESQRLGLPVEQAIVQMTHRAPRNRDLKIFAVSALIQRETGGNLAEILGNIAETIRARYKFYGKLRALTAEGRASGVVLGCLPLVMALLLRVLNPEYFGLLLVNENGRLLSAFAAALWLAGVVWLVQLTKVDV